MGNSNSNAMEFLASFYNLIWNDKYIKFVFWDLWTSQWKIAKYWKCWGISWEGKNGIPVLELAFIEFRFYSHLKLLCLKDTFHGVVWFKAGELFLLETNFK